MSKPKFKVGDRAGTRDGRTWRVREVSSAGTGVLLETEKDVKPYESSWFAVDTLSKPRGRTEVKVETQEDQTLSGEVVVRTGPAPVPPEGQSLAERVAEDNASGTIE